MKIMICLIDDDKFYQFFTKRMLEGMPGRVKEVLQFYDAVSALDYLRENINDEDKIPDIIFLDLNMPGLNGWDFLEELKNINFQKKSVIHICSSSVATEDIVKAQEDTHIDRYIIKPLKTEQIKNILESYFQYSKK
ncbi:response regulator [Salegentibacter maritimus]|uniref:response regulator n=1 Tax=Salegentibacter maritimus TaxID=2794347 RepID=UPI0018E48E9C|nr:response regulator [Salegentibacter maritimus]MBI6118061.1 response regulator [Salegentibacter maritimus]